MEQNLHLDTARQYYVGAANLYGRLTGLTRDEQEVMNSIIRFLYSTFNNRQLIPMESNLPSLDILFEDLVSKHPSIDKLFYYIVALVVHSSFAERRILKKMWLNHTLRNHILTIFEQDGLIQDSKEEQAEDAFRQLWDRFKRRFFDNQRQLLVDLRQLKTFSPTQRWLNDNLPKAMDIVQHRQLMKLDRERIRRISKIFNIAISVLETTSYETQDHHVEKSKDQTENLLSEIEASPTKLSIEELRPLLFNILQAMNRYQDELYEKSKPQLTLRLPKDFDVLTPEGKQFCFISAKNWNTRKRNTDFE